ncbi:MAG: prepilin-type N-terminal cleavage/methylation domain-containing protein [Sedimentisphaerales bacterium]
MKKMITKGGFTLVELAVVIVIIGVLAAFAVPKFSASVERSKAAEAFNYLSAIEAAQERYHAKQGTYANQLAALDIQFSEPKYFTVGEVQGDSLETGWRLTLTRKGASGGYGEYTVTFTQDGFDTENSTIATDEKCVAINPMQT